MVQQGNSGLMIYNFDKIVAYISNYFSVNIGDLIFTGTPAGVGECVVGDELELFIESDSLGNLDNYGANNFYSFSLASQLFILQKKLIRSKQRVSIYGNRNFIKGLQTDVPGSGAMANIYEANRPICKYVHSTSRGT